jgi:hypothetical protein
MSSKTGKLTPGFGASMWLDSMVLDGSDSRTFFCSLFWQVRGFQAQGFFSRWFQCPVTAVSGQAFA